MAQIKPNDIRNQLLKERGITITKPRKGKHRRVAPMPQQVSNIPKTPLMRYIEQKYNRPIREVLMSGSLSEVAKSIDGEVDVSTLSRWIKRFKLRYTMDNLPQCLGCDKYVPNCDLGVCAILLDLELWELSLIKRKEILG